MASERARKVLAEILELPDAERAEIANHLLRSLHGEAEDGNGGGGNGDAMSADWEAVLHDRAEDFC